jgi:hypothetical protein
MSSRPVIGGIGDSKPADDIAKDIAQKVSLILVAFFGSFQIIIIIKIIENNTCY